MSPQFDRYHNPVATAVRSGAQVVLLRPFVWSLLRVGIEGLDKLDEIADDQPFILVSNHCSHFDAPLLFCGLPGRLGRRMATGAAADYFFKHWYLAGLTSLLFNAFPVERASRQTPATPPASKGRPSSRGLAGTLLDEGTPLLIFPEGTRSRSGAMADFHPGSAALSISHQVPIVPAALVGTAAAWPASSSRWVSGRPPVEIVFGTPIWPSADESASDLNDRLRVAVVQLHDQAALAHGRLTQTELRARTDLAQAISPSSAE